MDESQPLSGSLASPEPHPLPETPDLSALRAHYRCPHCAQVVKGLVQYYGHINYHHKPHLPLVGKKARRAPTATELLTAMERAQAGIARASRELGVSIPYFIKWAQQLIPVEWAEYKTRPLAGIVKKGSSDISKRPIYVRSLKILRGERQPPKMWILYPHQTLAKLQHYGLMPDSCMLCGFAERRISDYRSPMLLDFLDGNQENWTQDNLRVLCYNCYFLNVHDLWGKSKSTALGL